MNLILWKERCILGRNGLYFGGFGEKLNQFYGFGEQRKNTFRELWNFGRSVHYFQGSREQRPPGASILYSLCFDVFSRRFIREPPPPQSGGGKCPHVPRNKGACSPVPPIENSLSFVLCSPLLSLFFCFHQKFGLTFPVQVK